MLHGLIVFVLSIALAEVVSGVSAVVAVLLGVVAGLITWRFSATHARTGELAGALDSSVNALAAASQELQATLDALPDLLFVMGLDGRYLEVRATRADLLVAPVGGLLGRTVHEVMPAAAARTVMATLQEAQVQGSSHGQCIELPLPEGSHWFELSVARQQRSPGALEKFVVLSRDITLRKLAEQKVARLTKLYAALSQCNQAIVRCHDEVELFDILCRDAVNFGGMKMAWIGKVEGAQQRLVPTAWYGDGTDFLSGFSVSLDANDPSGAGPASIAVRENRPYWCQDIHHDVTTEFLRERASRYGWGSAAALPLHLKGEVTGLLSVYSDVPDAFDAAVQSLLQEMVMDISFALDRFADEREQQRVQEALRDSEERYHKAFRTSPDSVNINRLVDGMYLDVNVGFEQLTGWLHDEVVGKTSAQINIWRDMADRQKLLDALRSEGRCVNLEADFVARDGHMIRGLMSAAVVHFNGVDCILNITRDISQMRRAEAQIEHLAHFDQLTGLPNRTLVRDHFDLMRSLAERSGESMALMFLDLDHFKSINDTLGHSVGDQLLVQVSQRLRATLRSQDTLARMGGDEFILLLSSVQADEAAQVAGKIIHTLESSCQVDHLELVSTASIGIAMYPGDGEDFETLSKNADSAMYRVKQGSRNGFCFFTQEMQKQSERALNLVNAMRHALVRQEFELHYQPQVSLQDGRIIGAEALLRWNSAELGPLMPGEFIPVAEDSGLILEIGEWVLRTAVAQARQWQQAGWPPLVVAVNLSAVQFRHPNLFGMVTRILDQAQLPAHYLEIELTEATAMDDPVAAVALMNKLHERGVRMSIDDFGTGYSSLSYLKKFKIYKLKIDQSFVRDISEDPDDKAIVSAIINLAGSLGMHTIAEGVETASQLAYLRLQGCDEVQGYYFTKPLPVHQFEAFWHEHPGVKCDPAV